jgi:hypothetical protein
MGEIATLSCDQIIDDPNSMPAAEQLFAEVRTDEAGAAGHEIGRHVRSAGLRIVANGIRDGGSGIENAKIARVQAA